jgi:hypothetical protein
MTQPTQRSLLNQEAYRNPRYAKDAEELAAFDKEKSEAQAPAQDTPLQEQQPEHNWEKRYKDLQSYNSRKQTELQSEIDGLQGKLTNAQSQSIQPLAVPKTAEELAAMKAQDPEGYSRIEAIAQTLMTSQLTEYDQKLATVTGDLLATKIDKAILFIKAAHPDYDQVIAADAFHTWAEKQDQGIQDWIYNNPDKPSLAVSALDLFKAKTGWGTNNSNQGQPTPPVSQGDMDVNIRTATQDQSQTDRNHPAYMWTESEIGKMRDDEFTKWEQHISLAQREGRVAIGQ